MTLHGKVCIVTGASSGIGKATALALGAHGMKVVLAARRMNQMEKISREIQNAGGQALPVQTDVAIESQVNSMIETATKQFGRIDILINNAGSGLNAKLEETTVGAMEQLWRTNFMGTFYAIRNVVPIFRQQGEGHIITVASMAAKRATPFNSAYCATKFAQVGLMESLRMELRGSGIRCSLVFPGPTDTEFLEHIQNPSGRHVRYHGSVQSPQQVASAIVDMIRNPEAEVIMQRFGRTLVVLNSLSPGLVDWIVSKTVKRKLMKRNEGIVE